MPVESLSVHQSFPAHLPSHSPRSQFFPIASLVRTRNSSFLRDCVRLRSKKAQTSRKYCGLVAFHRTRSITSEIIFFQSPTQGTVRIFATLYGYDYFTKRTRTEGIWGQTEEQNIYPPAPALPKKEVNKKLDRIRWQKVIRWSGDRISLRARFSVPVQIGPGAHLTSSTKGTRPLPRV